MDKKILKTILTDSQGNFPELKFGDIVVFSSDAELGLSYEDEEGVDGFVPSYWVRNGVWFVDAVDDDSVNVNCGNHPGGAGRFCSYGSKEDIIKVIRPQTIDGKRIQKEIWTKSINEDADSKYWYLMKKFHKEPFTDNNDPSYLYKLARDIEKKKGFDLKKYKTIDELETALYNLPKSRKELAREGTKEVFENNKVKIVRWDNYEACRSYSSRGKWCITNKSDWDEYREGDGEYTFYLVQVKNPYNLSPEFYKKMSAARTSNRDEDALEEMIPEYWVITVSNNEISELHDAFDGYYTDRFIRYFLRLNNIPDHIFMSMR